ncbi:MAG: tetratricopeptide repeat protein [Spirochaetaceae bacterium]
MYELNNKGVELSKNGKLDEAISVFKNALDINPNDANINFNIALVYIKKDKFNEAIKYLDISVEKDPNDDNLRELGTCYIRLNNLEKARESLVRAVTEYGSADSENSLGVLFFKLEHYDEAKRHFEHATVLNPESKDAWYNLADTYSELGMFKDSKAAKYKYDKLG